MPHGRPPTLTDLQARFVAEYLLDLNATAAAGRAGYSDPSWGRQLLAKPHVAAAIARARQRQDQRLEVKADAVLREYARVGFSDARRLVQSEGTLKALGDLDDDTAAAVASVEVIEQWEGQGAARRLVGHLKKVRLWPKTEALRDLAKHLGLLKEGPAGGAAAALVIVREILIQGPDHDALGHNGEQRRLPDPPAPGPVAGLAEP